jgi:hypothetical protein
MHGRIKLQLAAFGLILLLVAGCDLGRSTPTPVPAPKATATAIEQATKPAENTPVPADTATSAPTDTAVTSGIVATDTPQPLLTPSARQVVMFADYKLQPSSVNPSLKPYTVQAGLKNVSNAKDFTLPAATLALLQKNAFAAQFPSGDQYKQFYQLYEDGRYTEKPVFVSTDSVLHVYHLVFDKLLRTAETQHLVADLKSLTAAMLKASQDQYDQLKGTAAENAAKRNLAYFAVAASLLDPKATVPARVQTEVSSELNLIQGHAGLAQSAVMGIGGAEYMEDYGQYVPRGHYTRSEDLMSYFKAMMWYGRITFRLSNLDETRSALLLTQALKTASGSDGKAAKDAWANIYEPTAFFVGGADDLTYRDYAPVMDQALGAGAAASAVADDTKVKQFQDLSKAMAGPRINSMFVYIWEDKDAVTRGLRMMGQRFTLDEYVFGQLIWRNVGESVDNARWLPKALDVPAAFGSDEAYKILDQAGETKWLHYADQMQKVRGEIKNLPASQWTENLYWSWLYTFHPSLASKAPDSGYPSFMTNDAWTRKDLNTVLGSWTELKHDTILYSKQVMAEMGGGPAELPRGYVEPEPEFYARVAALVAMTRDGLLSRGLIQATQPDAGSSDYTLLNDLEKLALDLKKISEKELQGTALTQDEYTLIKFYGGRLESFTSQASDPAAGKNPADKGDLNDQDAAVVADVATGKDQALTEGTGRIMEIYVVAPIGGKLVLARGGIYSQYEFAQPSSNRLTDEQWRQRLDNKQQPPLGDWKSFIAP